MKSINLDSTKVILLTGASSGIGEETARYLALRGHYLIIGARRREKLRILCDELQAQGASVDALLLDVTQPQSLQKMVEFALEKYGRVDVLVNNAGVMPLSPLSALKVEEWNQTIDVNIKGVLHGIAAVLPVMQAQKYGQIINIASIGAHAVSPTAAVYCASKYAVRAISDGLRQETDTIRVTVISPGVVESELADHISDDSARAAMNDFRRIALPPQAIAQAISYVISQPDSVDISEMIVRPTASPH